ncbi:MAG: MBL fold metallo-hydrolase RNA specificity domain-containing protein, partial [Candidatus Hydrothermarchaeales archaeon]
LKRRDSWEERLLESCVNSDYIHRHQSELILHLDFIHFTELIDIKPDPGSVFIHSMSEPFEEDDIEDEVKHNWLDYFGLEFHQVHASGHCSKDEIFEVLKKIDPKRIFPIHTEYPKMFKDVFSNVQLVEKGKKYEI